MINGRPDILEKTNCIPSCIIQIGSATAQFFENFVLSIFQPKCFSRTNENKWDIFDINFVMDGTSISVKVWAIGKKLISFKFLERTWRYKNAPEKVSNGSWSEKWTTSRKNFVLYFRLHSRPLWKMYRRKQFFQIFFSLLIMKMKRWIFYLNFPLFEMPP